MKINALEELIVSKLKENEILSKYEIDILPDDMNKYNLKHPLGAILVYYKGSSFSPPQGVDKIHQDESINFDVIAMIQNVRSQSGLNDVLDEVKDHLAGLEIELEKVYPTKIGLYGQTGSTWKGFASFAITKKPYVHRVASSDSQEYENFSGIIFEVEKQ